MSRVEIGNDVSVKWSGRESKDRVILAESWSEGLGLARSNSFQVSDTIFVKIVELFWTLFYYYSIKLDAFRLRLLSSLSTYGGQ